MVHCFHRCNFHRSMSATRVMNSVLKRNYTKSFRGVRFFNLGAPNCFGASQMSSEKQLAKSQSESDSQVSTDFKEIVKENTKSAWYLSVIAAGVGVTCIMFYTIFKELFSSDSPNGVYGKAVKRIEKEYDLVEALGEPIKAFGEESRRGRRGHVAHKIFLDERGKKHMRMQFYVKGNRQSGTVYLEVKEDDSGHYDYRYFYVQLNDYKRTMFMIEDNRLREHEKLPENTIL